MTEHIECHCSDCEKRRKEWHDFHIESIKKDIENIPKEIRKLEKKKCILKDWLNSVLLYDELEKKRIFNDK